MRLFAGSSSSLASVAPLALALLGCGHTAIRVDGVMSESAEMRPLQNVPGDAYRQLKVLVRTGSDDARGAQRCGYTQVEGSLESEDLKNAACVPPDAQNDAVRIVRQRLRAYGVQVVRDATDVYDYAVDVRVTGAAPRRPDRLAAKAVARLSFTLRKDDGVNGFLVGVDPATAGNAFAAAAKDCALPDAELAAFSSSSTQPMNPEFDMMALAAGAVDNAIGCDQLARFFRDAHTRFPRAAPPPAPPGSAPPPVPPPP
ncbi:MAG TPA: hypothetical protein VHS09_00145 [Polyangiaceae bacterium]|jgi:hypothetical protein|nr:hypothetical protein [Polyangiaceae bacterium]